MAVALSSFKVDANFDPSSYVKGAQAKVAADQAMIAADNARIASLDRADAALEQLRSDVAAYATTVRDNSRAMAEATQYGQDTGRSFAMTGIEFANLADKAKTATIALYALSPGFRQLVNPAITASVRALGPAAVGAAGAAFAAFSPLLATIGRLALPIGIATESFRAMNAITELGAEKLKEFNELASGAGVAGVSTDFWQRQSAGAKELGIEVDQATEALKKFRDVDLEALGGSGFQQRLDQLTKAGNFAGNGGVAALKQATDVESRYRAAVDLISTAIDSGQRLAALDLASKFLPPQMLERLRASGSALKELQAAADATKPADIVDAAQVSYALELKRRLDDANETIANGLKPIQKDLAQLGLNYQESWVSIREAMASGVTHANDLYAALKGIPDLFAQAGSASFWTKLTDYTGKLGLNSSPESLGLTLPNQPTFLEDPARSALAAGLRNQAAMQQAMRQATTIQSAVRGDISLNPATAPAAQQADAVDRAIQSLGKHIEMQRADAAAAGLGAAAMARFRAEAAETAAVQANGGKETAEQAAQFKTLQERAAAAAGALERARVNSAINFGRQTTFLSPDDVQIAQQLKGIYPDVATALASVEASALRTNQALSGISSSISNDLTSELTDITTGAKSASQGFSDMTNSIIKDIEQMIIKLTIVGPLMQSLQVGLGGLTGGAGGIGSLLGAAGVSYGLPGTAGSNLLGPIAPSALGNVFSFGRIMPFAYGGIIGGPTLFPMANGAGLAGEAGPEAIMPLRRGRDGRLGVAAGGAANDNRSAGNVVVNIYNAPAGADTKVSQSGNTTTVDVVFRNAVQGVVLDDVAKNGPISQAITGRQRNYAGS